MAQSPTENKVYYYGRCPGAQPRKGQPVKWHTGHKVEDHVGDDGKYRVTTHCGNQMFQEGEGERPPAMDDQNEDLCKTCHRSYAWEEMKKSLDRKRQAEDELARQLDELAYRAETSDMGAIGIIREVRTMVESLRRTVQELPNGDEKPRLKLVANGN